METRIEQIKEDWVYFIDGEPSEGFQTKEECEDTLEDILDEINRGENDLVCEFCKEFYKKKNVQYRIEDNQFTAPYGSTFVWGGDIDVIPVCPICKGDLEEC